MPPGRDEHEAKPARIAERPSASGMSGAGGPVHDQRLAEIAVQHPASQCQYCTGNGSFSPSLSSSVATAAGVAYSPRMA